MVSRNKVGHCVALPSMAVKPESAIHREDHPISTANKLAVQRRGNRLHADSSGCRARTMSRRANLRSLRGRAPALSQRRSRIELAMPLDV